jgi:hypothetical protein
MATEIWVALIGSGLALAGTIVGYVRSAKKDELDVLRGVIDSLNERIQQLEDNNADLEDWAERLVCQVKEAGLLPAKFIRHKREH